MLKSIEAFAVEAELENLDYVLGKIETSLGNIGCPQKVIMQILLSVEELFVNVANYAYIDEIGRCKFLIETERNETNRNQGQVAIEMRDTGRPFNPLEREDPDITLSAEERQIGGLGIFMTKQIMDEIDYRFEKNENIVVMKKKWNCETESNIIEKV